MLYQIPKAGISASLSSKASASCHESSACADVSEAQVIAERAVASRTSACSVASASPVLLASAAAVSSEIEVASAISAGSISSCEAVGASAGGPRDALDCASWAGDGWLAAELSRSPQVDNDCVQSQFGAVYGGLGQQWTQIEPLCERHRLRGFQSRLAARTGFDHTPAVFDHSTGEEI